MLICDRLKAARKECKLTQLQVADLLGIDRSTYAYYELGVSNPSIENLVKLASIFKVDVDFLIGSDKKANSWKAPENTLEIIRKIKEKNISELSKDERMIVSFFRILNQSGKRDEVFKLLYEMTENSENEK